ESAPVEAEVTEPAVAEPIVAEAVSELVVTEAPAAEAVAEEPVAVSAPAEVEVTEPVVSAPVVTETPAAKVVSEEHVVESAPAEVELTQPTVSEPLAAEASVSEVVAEEPVAESASAEVEVTEPALSEPVAPEAAAQFPAHELVANSVFIAAEATDAGSVSPVSTTYSGEPIIKSMSETVNDNIIKNSSEPTIITAIEDVDRVVFERNIKLPVNPSSEFATESEIGNNEIAVEASVKSVDETVTEGALVPDVPNADIVVKSESTDETPIEASAVTESGNEFPAKSVNECFSEQLIDSDNFKERRTEPEIETTEECEKTITNFSILSTSQPVNDDNSKDITTGSTPDFSSISAVPSFPEHVVNSFSKPSDTTLMIAEKQFVNDAGLESNSDFEVNSLPANAKQPHSELAIDNSTLTKSVGSDYNDIAEPVDAEQDIAEDFISDSMMAGPAISKVAISNIATAELSETEHTNSTLSFPESINSYFKISEFNNSEPMLSAPTVFAPVITNPPVSDPSVSLTTIFDSTDLPSTGFSSAIAELPAAQLDSLDHTDADFAAPVSASTDRAISKSVDLESNAKSTLTDFKAANNTYFESNTSEIEASQLPLDAPLVSNFTGKEVSELSKKDIQVDSIVTEPIESLEISKPIIENKSETIVDNGEEKSSFSEPAATSTLAVDDLAPIINEPKNAIKSDSPLKSDVHVEPNPLVASVDSSDSNESTTLSSEPTKPADAEELAKVIPFARPFKLTENDNLVDTDELTKTFPESIKSDELDQSVEVVNVSSPVSIKATATEAVETDIDPALSVADSAIDDIPKMGLPHLLESENERVADETNSTEMAAISLFTDNKDVTMEDQSTNDNSALIIGASVAGGLALTGGLAAISSHKRDSTTPISPADANTRSGGSESQNDATEHTKATNKTDVLPSSFNEDHEVRDSELDEASIADPAKEKMAEDNKFKGVRMFLFLNNFEPSTN
ncbi:hypothetical protein D0Z03_000581, partial [Geotrichum reessii]